jgi:anti-sigma factor RsiW
MIAEATEFQISQYVDGTLSAAERSAVESLVASDAGARKVLADYRQLNKQLIASQGVPAMNWDRLSNQISDSINRESDRPLVAGRIGFWSVPMRIAAAVLLTAGATLLAYHHHAQVPVSPTPTDLQGGVAVSGPSAETSTAPGSLDVSVGPSVTAMKNDAARYGLLNRGDANRPSRVVISGITSSAKNDSH